VDRLHGQNVVNFGGEGETSNLKKYPRVGFLKLLSRLEGAGSRMRLAKLFSPSSEVILASLDKEVSTF